MKIALHCIRGLEYSRTKSNKLAEHNFRFGILHVGHMKSVYQIGVESVPIHDQFVARQFFENFKQPHVIVVILGCNIRSHSEYMKRGRRCTRLLFKNLIQLRTSNSKIYLLLLQKKPQRKQGEIAEFGNRNRKKGDLMAKM